MEMLNSIVLSLNNVLTSSVLLIALVGAGIWFSIQLGFVQVKGFGEGMKRTFGGMFKKDGKKAGDDGMSSFQALATAIAAQVGTGNIAGAATAIAVGGPGAIFWMWVSAFLGMATIFGEACMAQKYKQVAKDGSVTGGPVYYIKAAFSGGFGKVLAAVFAVLVILALGFMGNIVQSNSIAASWNNAFGVPKIAMGIVLAVISFLVFSGGMGRIAKVTETIVPIMAAFYILGALIVIIANGNMIPSAFHDIIVGAFDPTAVAGGAMGATIKLAVTKGVARGLFSNEAGMGSTPHAHALAQVENPHIQGTVAMAGVFIDTFVVLTLNALVIISCLYAGDGPLANGYVGEVTGVLKNTNLAQTAFGIVFGEKLGAGFVAIALFFFAFSTILGWNLFAKINVTWLFGEKAQKPFILVALVFIFLGTIGESDLVWGLSDLFNQLMVIPNVIALFALTGSVLAILNKYGKK